MSFHYSEQITCKICDKQFDSTGFGQHIRLIHKISRKEYAEKYQTEEWINCPFCGKKFFCRLHDQHKSKCCSHSCRSSLYHREKENAYKEEISFCVICGTQFIKDNRNRKNKRFCSKKCAAIFVNARMTLKQKREKWNRRKETMIANNTYDSSCKKSGTKCHEFYQNDPERARERALKTAIKKRENGDYDFEKSSSRAKNAHLTKLKNNSYISASINKNNTILKNGGYNKITEKCHETKKRKGTYGKSKAEDVFYEKLKQHFQTTHRQIKINSSKFIELFGRKIEDYKRSFTFDFAISVNDKILFVCFDGIYYHGLDRQIAEIAKCKTKTDRTIFETYYRDRYLEDFISSKKIEINVVRITDLGKVYFSFGDSYVIDSFLKKLSEID